MFYRILVYICLILGSIGFLAASFADSTDITTQIVPNIDWQLNQYWSRSHEANLWTELSDNFQLNRELHEPTVQRQIQSLKHRQRYFNQLAHNAKPYLYYIYSQTRRYNMPAEIALIPMIESEYDPFSVSNRGAAGLWQMMPGTASGLGLKIDWSYDGRRSIIRSTDAALKHLKYLYSYFGNWLLAVAAYDSGDGTVRAAIQYNKRHHRPTDFWHLPLPTETKLYVPKLLGIAAIIAAHNHYGLTLNNIPNYPYFDSIEMKGPPMELSRVAKLAKTDIKTVRNLNPAFRHQTISSRVKSGKYQLLLPKDKANLFQKAMNKSGHPTTTTQEQPHHISKTKTYHAYITYTVKRGDNLSHISDRYHTTPHAIMQLNGMKSVRLKIGKKLKIPNSHLATHKKNHVSKHTHNNNKTITHTVRSGQSLSTIAHRYHVSLHKVMTWNHLRNRKLIHVGDKLKIYLH